MRFDSEQLRALSSILRNGSFDAAATELGVTQSAISQRIRSLEEQVGAKLVNRERPSTGTPAGRRIAAHAEHLNAMEQSLARDLGAQAQPQQGRIRIAVNADSLATWFLKPLSEVSEYLYALKVDDQDFSDDLLRNGEVAAAVTSNGAALSGCDAHSLGNLRYVATASPDFMENYFPSGMTEDALKIAPMLRFNEKDNLQFQWLDMHVNRVVRPPFHLMPSPQAFVEACKVGLGWGINPEPLVREALKTGELVLMTPEAHLDLPLYWQVSRLHKQLLAPLTRKICQTTIQ